MQSNNDEAVVSLVVDASGLRRGSEEAANYEKRIRASLKGVEDAAKNAGAVVTESTSKVVKALNDQTRFLSRIERDLNPFQTAIRSASNDLNRLVGILEAGGRNAERAGNLIAGQAQKVASLQRAYSDATSHIQAYNQAIAESAERQDRANQAAIRRYQQMVNEARMLQNATNSQQAFNRVLGVNPGSGADSAQHSASVFQQSFAREKDLFDQETRNYERLAARQANATNRMIENLKRFQTEQEKANKERAKFLEQMAPSSSIAAHKKQLEEAERGVKGFSTAQNAATHTSRVMQYTLTNLSFQVNDVVSGLVMGQTPFRIFAQQAGQFVQLFSQGGGVSKVLNEAADAAGRWVKATVAWAATPIGAITLGISGLVAVLATMLTRSANNAQTMREFDQALAGLETRSRTSSRDLLQLSYDLRAVGVGADDANKAIGNLGRNLNVNLANPQAIRQLTQLGLNVGARLGIGDAEGMEKVNQAIKDNVEGLVKLGLETRSISQTQATAALNAANLGNRLETQNRLINDISTNLAGQHEKLRSGWSKFIDSIGAGWNAVINKISDTGVFSAIDSLFERMANNLKFITETGKTAPGTIANTISNAITPPLPTEAEMRQRAQGLIRQTPSVYGPGLRAGADLTSGGALTGSSLLEQANRFGKNITDLNTEFRQKVEVWLGMLDEADRAAAYVASGARTVQDQIRIKQRNPGGIAAQPGGSLHHDFGFGAMAIDMGGVSDRALSLLSLAGLRQNVIGDRGHIEDARIPLSTQATAETRRQFATGLAAQSTGTVAAATVADTNATKEATTAISQYDSELTKLNQNSQQRIDNSKLTGIELRAETAYTSALQAALDAKKPADVAEKEALIAKNEARQTAINELAKEAKAVDLNTQGTLSSADAYNRSAVDGLKAEAMTQAVVASYNTGVPVIQKYNEILLANAAAALQSASSQNSQATLQLENEKKIAEASKISAKAQHDAEIEAKAAQQTQEALNKALATGNDLLITAAANSQKRAEALIKEREAQQRIIDTNTFLRDQEDQRAQLRLQFGLVGQPTEVIQANLALLQKQQELTKKFPEDQKDLLKAQLDSYATTQKMNIALAESEKEFKRLEDGVKSIAEKIDSSLTSAVKDAFDGKRVTDWGAKIKSMVSDLAAQFVSSSFIKPLLGTGLSALGFTNLGQSFGNFFGSSGSLGGLFSSSGTTNVANGSVVLTPNGSGGFTLSNLGSAASLANNVAGGGMFSSSSGGLFGGIKTFLNDTIGTALGFSGSNVVAGTGAGSGIFTNLTTGATSDVLGSGVASGLFGGTTFTGFLGGAGAGLGAGMLLNSLLGGNRLTGGIGSGVGSLLGAGIGSIFGGPMIGGLLGGTLGSLFGLFGSNKPRNQSAGGNIDLTTGLITGTFTGGNQSIDQSTISAVKEIGAFTRLLLKGTGGTLSGNVLFQGGVNTGFTADSSLPGYKGRYNLGKDADEAVRLVELALAKSVEGVSETTKLIISKIDDPADIERGIEFASVYDNLKKAADDAFASISSDTDVIGPFAQSLDEINDIFAEITDTATEFGLSLDPVNQSLIEAKKRLTEDFDRSIKDMILSIEDSTEYALEIERRAGDARIEEAKAVGGDLVEVEKLNALKIDEILKAEEDAAADAAKEIDDQLSTLSKFRTSVSGGELSGRNITDQVTNSLDAFNQALGDVLGGDLDRINDLISYGTEALNLSVDAYGNAPQTADLRTSILAGVDQALAERGFAGGTESTPSGWIQVHKDEWMYQRGGNVVVPRGQNPSLPGVDELVSEVRSMRAEMGSYLDTGNRLAGTVGDEVVKRLDKQIRKLDQAKPIYQPAVPSGVM